MPISSERYRAVVEQPTSYGQIDSAQLRAALNRPELRGVLGDETDVDAAAAIGRLVDQANAYGLELDDVEKILPEMIQQLQIEANATARHGHDVQRRKTKFYQIPAQIGLRWQEMLETFGRGKIADRAIQHRQQRVENKVYLESLTNAALERASLRKRFHQYLTIGGADLQAAVQEYTHGRQDKVNIKDRDVTITSGQSEQFIHDKRVSGAVEKIIDQLDIPDPFEIGQNPDGTSIEIPVTPETETIIRKHLRFILRDELSQLVQMSTMEVMTTKQYEVESRKLSVTASKILGSGSVWGCLTRTGGKLVIGGSLAAASWAAVPVGGAVLAAFGIGAVAGAASQVAQYYGARRQQRKMDLAIGAEHRTVYIKPERYYTYDVEQDGKTPTPKQDRTPKAVEVTKSAESINRTLQVSAEALAQEMAAYHQRPNEVLGERVIQSIYAVYGTIVDTEFRLLQTRRGYEKQDYINFGLDNRLASQSELLKNIRNANEIIHNALELFARDVPADLPEDWMGNPRIEMQYQDSERMRFIDIRERMNSIAKEAQYEIDQVAENLESALRQGEGQRILVGAAMGGTFASLTAMAMGYIQEWFSAKAVDVRQPPTFLDNQAQQFEQAGQKLTIAPTPSGDLTITDAGGHSQILDLKGMDVHQVVLDQKDLRLYDATTGKPVGHLELDLVPPAAAYFKEPELPTTLSPERPQLITCGDKQFGLVVDADGNIMVHPTNPTDHKLDMDHPLTHTPLNVFAEDVRNQIEFFEAQPETAQAFAYNAAQLHVETSADDVVTIQSVYDQSVVARFKIDSGSGSLTTAPESVPGAGSTRDAVALLRRERLFADPATNPVAKLLNTMGVEQTDLNVNADGTIEMKDVGVQGEWRQQRLGLMLEAYQHGQIDPGESAEVVLARLERATRHVLSEAKTYPSHEAALKEAFGRTETFIQKAEVPYVHGGIKGYDGVSKQWTELVDGLRHLPAESAAIPPGAGAVGHTGSEVAAPWVDNLVRHPVALEDFYQPGAESTLAAHYLEDSGYEGYFEDVVQTIRQTAALGVGTSLVDAAEGYMNGILDQSHLTGSGSTRQRKERGTTIDSFMYDQTPDEEAGSPQLRRRTRSLPRVEGLTTSQRILEQNLRGVSPEVLSAWQREFSGALGSLVFLTNHLRTEGLLNDQNMAELARYLDAVPSYGTERLINAKIRYADGQINLERIRQIVERFRDQPDQNPFIEQDVSNEEALTTRIPRGHVPPSRRLVPGGDGRLRSPYSRPDRTVEMPTTEADLNGRQTREQLERSLRERFEAIDAGYVIEGLLHEDHFQGHLDVINALADAFTEENIFDEAHLRLLVTYLLVVPGEGADMLQQAGLLGENNQPNVNTITRVATRMNRHPDRNPFLMANPLNSRTHPQSDSRSSAPYVVPRFTPPPITDDKFDVSPHEAAEGLAPDAALSRTSPPLSDDEINKLFSNLGYDSAEDIGPPLSNEEVRDLLLTLSDDSAEASPEARPVEQTERIKTLSKTISEYWKKGSSYRLEELTDALSKLEINVTRVELTNLQEMTAFIENTEFEVEAAASGGWLMYQQGNDYMFIPGHQAYLAGSPRYFAFRMYDGLADNWDGTLNQLELVQPAALEKISNTRYKLKSKDGHLDKGQIKDLNTATH